MFAGHVGVGLALARAERRVSVGVFVVAALGLDVVLWLLVLLGWETVSIPADFAISRQPTYHFPYSHSLLAAVGWSALAGLLAHLGGSRSSAGRQRVAALVAAAVFSHWLLDALVHRPELPLAGSGTAAIGLALWDHLPVALVAEGALVVIGLGLFLRGSGHARGRATALVVLSVVIVAFTVIGMTAAPPPPSAQAMALSSLATLAGVCALVAWIGRGSGSSV